MNSIIKKGIAKLLFLLVVTLLFSLLIQSTIAEVLDISEIDGIVLNNPEGLLEKNLEIDFWNYEVVNLTRNPILFTQPINWKVILGNGKENLSLNYETPPIYINVEEEFLEEGKWQQVVTFLTEYSRAYENVPFNIEIPYSVNVSIYPENITYNLTGKNLTLLINNITNSYIINITGKLSEELNETLLLPTTITNNYFSEEQLVPVILEVPGEFKDLAFEINTEENEIADLLVDLDGNEIISLNLDEPFLIKDTIVDLVVNKEITDPGQEILSTISSVFNESILASELSPKEKSVKINTKISSLKVNKNRLENAVDNKFNATLILKEMPVKIIKFENLEVESNTITLGIEQINETLGGKEFIQSYAIDPEKMKFDNATVTVVAKGTKLYKCKDWNFSTQTCFGEWELFKDNLIPGKEYTFELSQEDPGFGETLNILNVQSYPSMEGNWTVMFNTTGVANLTITAINDTTFGEVAPDDLKLLELFCGNETVNYNLIGNSIFVENYSCDKTGQEISKILTSGKHYLMFEFGDEVEYARNSVNDFKVQRGVTAIPVLGTTITIDAGTDYEAPASLGRAFIRLTNTRLSGSADNTSGGSTSQDPGESMVTISNSENLLTNITFERAIASASYNTLVHWEIIEYTGESGGANEFIVRDQDIVDDNAVGQVSGSSVSTVVNDSDVVVFITGQREDSTTNSVYDRGLHTSEWLASTDVPQFTKGDTAGTSHISYAVVEFIGSNWKIQRVTHTQTDTGPQTETIPVTLGNINKAFVHAQTRTNDGKLDEQGLLIWLSSTSQVSFERWSTASATQNGVAWIIENTQTTGTQLSVQHISGTRAKGEAEPDTWYETITSVSNMVTTSIMGECGISSGGGTTVPRGPAGVILTEDDNVTLFRTDTGQNLDYRFSVVQWATEPDTEYPKVEDFSATPDPQKITESVLITVNISDNKDVDFAQAIIYYPNSTQKNIAMTDDDSNGVYNCTFTNTGNKGVYNISIWANDTSNNINNTLNDSFTIELDNLDLITNQQSYVFNQRVLIVGEGFNPNTDITITLYDPTMDPMLSEGYPKNITSNSSGQINDSWKIPDTVDLGTYTINMTDTSDDSRAVQETFDVVTAVIQGDKDSYEQAETINITGFNWDNDVNVTINITNSTGGLVYGPLNITSNSTGFVNDTWFTDYNRSIQSYTLSAFEPSNPSKSDTFEFIVIIRPVEIIVDKLWYKIDDILNMTGTGFSLTKDITIDIFDSSNVSVPTYPKNITSNLTGGITSTWTVPVAQSSDTYVFNASDYAYPNLNNEVIFNVVVQNTSTDSSAYSSGDNVYVSGIYWDRGSNVTIDIKNSTGSSTGGYPKDIEVLSDGTFSVTWVAQPGAGFGAETYNISVEQKLDSTENSSSTVDVTKAATLNTDKEEYYYNENVSINGSFYAVTGAVEIAIWSVDESGYAQGYPLIVQSDSSGDIVHEWNVTDYCQGDYKVESEDQTYPLQLNAEKTFSIVHNDPTNISCSDVWGADCSLWPASSEGDNTFDACSTSASTSAADEHVDGGFLNATVANPGDTVSVTCNFVPYGSGGTELYIWYYDGSSWTNLYTFADTDGSTGSITRSVVVTTTGTHWFRCIADWDGTGSTCEGGSYFDHDDISLTVVAKPSSCTNFDVTAPNITQIVPAEDSQYNLTNSVLITANITDNTAISFVKAVVNYSNGSQQNFTMTDDNIDDIYNFTFIDTDFLGTYDITIWANDTWNNLNSSETTYFDVVDLIYPNWSSNFTDPISPVVYSPSQNYQFNVSWSDNYDLDTVWIEHNFTGVLDNYSITDNLSEVYYYNYSSLAAGNYAWRMYANDTSNNINSTDQFNYIVLQSTGSINLTLDTFEDNLTIEVKSIVNITANAINPTDANINLYQNGSLVNSGVASLTNLTNYTVLGDYNITSTYLGDENYTSDSKTWWITVEDTTNPSVKDLSPSGTKFNTTEVILISANVSDNYLLDKVYANITWDLSDELIELTDGDADGIFDENFTTTSIAGRYNYTILVNDTSGNDNNTENNYFILLDVPLVTTDKQSYVRGGTVLINGYGFNLGVNVTIDIYNSTGNSIPTYSKNIISNSSGGINDSWLIPGWQNLGVYVINLTDTTDSTRQVNKTFDIVTAVIEGDSNAYVQGETINITGFNWDNGVDVTINITDPASAIVYGPLNITSNDTGYVNDTWFINYNASIGDYLISSIQPSNNIKNDTFGFSVTERITSLSLDYDWYKIDDSVNAVGTGMSPTNDITINIFNSTSESVFTYPKNISSNDTGEIENEWIIPPDQSDGIYYLNITDYDYPNLNNQTSFEIVIQSANSDDSAYLSGDTVFINGAYWDRGTNVIIDIKNSTSDSAPDYPKTISVDSLGNFSHTWIALPGQSLAVEAYTFTVEQELDATENDNGAFDVTRVALLETNKLFYDQNESVIITGSFFSANSDVELTIYCLDNGGIAPNYPKNVTSDSVGNISDSWNTTVICNGSYSINAEDQTYPAQLNVTTYFNITYANYFNSVETADDSTLSGNYNSNGGNYANTHTSDNNRQYLGAIDANTEVHAWLNYTYDLSSLSLDSPENINNFSLEMEYCHSGDQVGKTCGGGYPAEGTVIGTQDVEIWNFTSSSWKDIGDIPFNNESDTEISTYINLSTGFSDLVDNDEIYIRFELNFDESGSNDTYLLIDYLGLTVNYHDPVDRDCDVFDVTEPDIKLIGPLNNSGDIDGNVSFSYNISDFSNVTNCSLYINGALNQTNSSIVKDSIISFELNNLPIGGYDWNITCIDNASIENRGFSEARKVNIIYATEYLGATMTNLSLVDAGNITNFFIDVIDEAQVNFTETLNLSDGSDLNEYINITNNSITIDSINEPRLNITATITLHDLEYQALPIILRNGEPCSGSICDYVSYNPALGELIFNVSHFTTYGATANSNLTIWDELDTDESNVKYLNEQVGFYANFTNKTNGVSISGADAYCEYIENSSGSWSSPVNMTYNGVSEIYEYNKSFTVNGTFWFNVSCFNNQGYENISLLDDFLIIHQPDLDISNVVFSDTNFIEGKNITISINVTNIGSKIAENFTLELNASLWNGSKIWSETFTNSTLSLTQNEIAIVNFTWIDKIGTYIFEVDVDIEDNVSEYNETNNDYVINITTLAWEILYGDYEYNYTLKNGNDDNLIVWNPPNKGGNLFYADYDASFNIFDLAALTGTDLADADVALGLTGFNDSIKNLFDTDGNNVPDATRNIELAGSTVSNIPIIESTNSSAFITGLLWDSSDGASYTGAEDLVIISIINASQVGKYGTYDYEVRVPATLGALVGGIDLLKVTAELE